ncbi:hypothetical protein Tco_0632346 [Tanacetum coccineum]
MSNHEQPTPSHPKSDVRNTTGKDKQTPQGSTRTTSAVDLEEFCEKHYEKLLPIMADKQKITQSFSPNPEISFPSLRDDEGAEGPWSSKVIPIECAMVSGPEDQPLPFSKVKEEMVKVVINPEYPEQTVMVGSNLMEETRVKLCNLLQRSLDPVRQKKKGQAAERNIAINDEVSKLVAARIMREVHNHDWLSYPVMVKKNDNSWRMCVDFKDLNKACPKDGYPLP